MSDLVHLLYVGKQSIVLLPVDRFWCAELSKSNQLKGNLCFLKSSHLSTRRSGPWSSGYDRKIIIRIVLHFSQLETLRKVQRISGQLRVPGDKVDEVKHLLERTVDGDWGAGRWVDVLVAACVYIVIRQSQLPLTIPEVAVRILSPPQFFMVVNDICSNY